MFVYDINEEIIKIRDEESNNDDGSDTDSEYNFNVPPSREEDISSASFQDMSSFPEVENHLSGIESHTGSPMNLISSIDLFACSSSTNGNYVGNNEPEQVHEDSVASPTSLTNRCLVGSIELEQVQQTSSILPNWHGFKLVGDNIDKNVRPSFSRSDRSTQSLHYFHYYAALDRVNLSSFSDATPNTEVDAEKLVINQEDIAQLCFL